MSFRSKIARSFVVVLAVGAVMLLASGCDPVRDGFRAGVQDGVKGFVSDLIGQLTNWAET